MAYVRHVAVVMALVHASSQYWDLAMTTSPRGPVVEGTDVLCTCIIDSDPPSGGWIQWQFSLDQIFSTDLTEPTYQVIYTNLTLGEVHGNQSGWYRCAGSRLMPSSNWKPRAFSKWTAVKIFYRPEITNKDRTWIGADENHPATLECVIVGNPLPTVMWYSTKDTAITNDTDPGRVYLKDTISGDEITGFLIESQLTIFTVRSTDYGIYRCRAANNISLYDEHEIHLNNTGKPDAPKNLRAYYVTENDMRVVWAPGYDGGETVEFYYINIRVIPRDFDPLGWNELNPDWPRGHFSDLKQDTPYQVAVYAQNRHGSGPCATVDKRTKPNSPLLLGIRVSYRVAQTTLFVAGMPKGDNAGTCLQLTGYDVEHNEWVSLRPDLDCIQHDGEFQYSGPHAGHMHCRYCRDGVCGKESHITEEYLSTAPGPRPPLPTWQNGRNRDATVFIMAVFGVFLLLLAFLAFWYRRKLRGCVKTTSSEECAGNGAQPNTTIGVEHNSSDAPPSYLEAIGMRCRIIVDDYDNPPPRYDYVLSYSLQQQAEEGEE
ncbi:netrin receptor DCC-like [Acanthaster planci]|uniref:Netrin receptor DCC-like n=1 Tax=Acanthaster planci TaxID=133434 RepID=A0A8B7ZWV1_ACAPL|nr:netrin receptor DCC-like [Acanthaster planci]